MKSKGEIRVIEGDAASDEKSDILSTFSDAAGDPRILVREKYKKKIDALKSRERTHTHSKADAARTLAELANHIRSNGGDVAGVVTLANASRVNDIAVTQKQIREIERRFGDVIRQELDLDPESLTGAEAGYLLNFRDADSLRTQIAAAILERDKRLGSKGIQPSAAQESQLTADGLEPVASLTGKELGVEFRGEDDLPALRKAAVGWYDDNLRGTTANMVDGAEVQFSRKGMGKSTSKGDLLLRSIPAIRSIIERGRIVHREPGNRAGIVERIVIAASVSLDGNVHNLAV